MNTLPMGDADKQRWQILFACIEIAPFGSLFRVDENVWKTGLGTEYAVRSTRDAHPGCSLRKLGATLGPVPMLHGTSSRSYSRENVAVKNIYGKSHTTYFGGLDPIPVDQEHWRLKNIKRAAKTSLDADEMRAMQALCARKGW